MNRRLLVGTIVAVAASFVVVAPTATALHVLTYPCEEKRDVCNVPYVDIHTCEGRVSVAGTTTPSPPVWEPWLCEIVP